MTSGSSAFWLNFAASVRKQFAGLPGTSRHFGLGRVLSETVRTAVQNAKWCRVLPKQANPDDIGF